MFSALLVLGDKNKAKMTNGNTAGSRKYFSLMTQAKKCRNLLIMFAVDEVGRLCYENQNVVQKAVDDD